MVIEAAAPPGGKGIRGGAGGGGGTTMRGGATLAGGGTQAATAVTNTMAVKFLTPRPILSSLQKHRRFSNIIPDGKKSPVRPVQCKNGPVVSHRAMILYFSLTQRDF
jgi:hypothetical protein